VQIEGVIAIYLMFVDKEEEDKSQKLRCHAIANNIQEILFPMIKYESKEDEAALYARDALTELASDQYCKDLLLQKACFGGYNKCAEFMIGLGASLDARPDVPLCIAVTNNNKKLVEILLSYDRTNAYDALALCLEQQNFDIAGVLLRYIGFEQESGNLIWGALNIKELKPELILNTLTFEPLESKNPLSVRIEEEQGLSRTSSVGSNASSPPSAKISESFVHLDVNAKLERSSSESSFDDIFVSVSRKIKSMSGPHLPYNQADPRLERRHSEGENEKHLILFSTRDRDHQHYPRQPNASPMIGKSAGNLLPPIERCVTPILFGKRRRKMKNSPSDGAITCPVGITEAGRPRFNTNINLEPSKPKVMKCESPMTPRRSRHAFSCVIPPRIENNTSIKTLDISYNQLLDIDQFVQCPSIPIVNLLNQLQSLHLNGNLLTEFSAECCKTLPGLKVLNLASNQLVSFPYDILRHQNLETLDVSNNQIVRVDPERVVHTLSLIKLDMSANRLKEFPSWVGTSFPRLAKLVLRGNEIREIPNKSFGFRSIKEINLSHNVIVRVSANFFKSCLLLEKIDLSHNVLETLPNFTPSTLSRLSQVKLAHNRLEECRPFYIPRSLLSIPSLQIVDLSDNRITQMPNPQMWTARGLKELSLARNRIKKVNISKQCKQYWPDISRLNLSGNKIEKLPPEIGYLDSLISLNLSHNQIHVFPDEIGRLKKIFELPLEGMPLQHDLALSEFRAQDIIRHYGSKLENAVPYRRIKLMLVGNGGRGKTSLLRQLANLKHPSHNVATVGIELRDWELKAPGRKVSKNPTSVILNTWDFAGQEEFYSTHQYFLTSRALYLAVFDASNGRSELDNLRTWLLNIQASAPGAMVVLVGTHSDKIPSATRDEYLEDLFRYINQFTEEPGFPKIHSKYIVNCKKETPAIEALRKEIYGIISNFRYEGQQIIKQTVPRAYVALEDLLKKELEQLSRLCVDNNLIVDEEELKCALKFLKETGKTITAFFYSYFDGVTPIKFESKYINLIFNPLSAK